MEKPKQIKVSEWYLEIGKKAQLFDYGPVKGSIIIRPYAYAIWERIQQELDSRIKDLGCQNAYFPLFIPESFLKKEAEHIEGFSPELAVVTYAGGKKLEEAIVIRPTSETVMYDAFARWINSWRDLPLKINQWANIVRWELRPFPFLRTTEFLWHEAHTAHVTLKEADEQTIAALRMYSKFFEDILAIPVVIGKKSEREKFAGALYSTSCEALLMDGKALQIATAHNLGQNFSKPFNVTYQNISGQRDFVWQTSWGVSTRAIGGLILTHGDVKGLVLPPKIAPIQVIVVPIIGKGEEKDAATIKQCKLIFSELQSLGIRVEVDFRDQVTPGWKFNEWEMKGVPVRIELGPKDIEKNSAVIARRDTGEKTEALFSNLKVKLPEILQEIQNKIFESARVFVRNNTREAKDFDEFKKILENQRGFIKAAWCGDSECEATIKNKTKATTRCIPLDSEKSLVGEKCFHCGNDAKCVPIWARAY